MNYTEHGNPAPENGDEIRQAIQESGIAANYIRFIMMYSTRGEVEDYGYVVFACDPDTGDELFVSQLYETKAFAQADFLVAGIEVIEDQTWVDPDMGKFYDSMKASPDQLVAFYHNAASVDACLNRMEQTDRRLTSTFTIIWNLFTAFKNEYDVEQMMSWPTFRYDFFTIVSDADGPTGVCLHGAGLKDGLPQGRTLTIHFNYLSVGPDALEDFLKRLCAKDRKAFEASEFAQKTAGATEAVSTLASLLNDLTIERANDDDDDVLLEWLHGLKTEERAKLVEFTRVAGPGACSVSRIPAWEGDGCCGE